MPSLLYPLSLYRSFVARLCLVTLGVYLPPLPRLRPGIYLFTHMSTLDALVMNSLLPSPACHHITTLAKVEMLRIPFIGVFAAVSGCVSIDRADKGASIRGLEECKLRAGGGERNDIRAQARFFVQHYTT